MRPAVYTVTGTQQSDVYTPSERVTPFNVALGVTVTGVSNYTVQYTFDDVFARGFVPASANWVNHPSLTGLTASADSNIAYPVRGIRIIANSGAGSARLTVIQAGGGRA
jgi:hypothetical protein